MIFSFLCSYRKKKTFCKMTIDFYYLPGSAPCRAVRMAAKAVGVDLNLKLTNLMAGEHLKPEFLKVCSKSISNNGYKSMSFQKLNVLIFFSFFIFAQINPQHTIPTLVDEGFALWESRAILVYLVEKYAKTDSLYPKCPKKRALINQRLYFDLGTLYQRLADYYYPQIFAKAPADPEKLQKLQDAVGFLDTFLEGQTYVAGDTLTVADISLVATVSTLDVAGFDLSKYTNVTKWYNTCKSTVPGYDINEAGLVEFKKFFNH